MAKRKPGIIKKTRREVLKWLGAGVAGLVIPSCFEEEGAMTTNDAYGIHWKPIARRHIEILEDLNYKVDTGTDVRANQERINRFKVDAVLQEFPYLKEEGFIPENSIGMGRYELEVLEYTGPRKIKTADKPSGKPSDVIVKVRVYEDNKAIGSRYPVMEEREINLGRTDWNLERIINR